MDSELKEAIFGLVLGILLMLFALIPQHKKDTWAKKIKDKMSGE